jgi:hypothetical protein
VGVNVGSGVGVLVTVGCGVAVDEGWGVKVLVGTGLAIPGNVHAWRASANTSMVRSGFFMKTTILVSVGGVKAGFIIGFYIEGEFTGNDSSCIMFAFIRLI